MKLTKEEALRKKEAEIEKKLFERKIEEDRLGISRKKQKRVMSFMAYRVVKLILLALTGIALFIYTPAVLPLTILIALMMIITKRIEKEKNKNVNKRYRIKIRAIDSVIAILMITLTFGVTAYSLVTAYTNDGQLNDAAAIEQRMTEQGFSENQIKVAVSRMTEGTSYNRILNDALTLLTGNRNSFSSGRGGMVIRGRAAPDGSGGSNIVIKDMAGGGSKVRMKRPNIFEMMRNMPLEMVFEQLFRMVCAVAAGIMVVLGIINVVGTFKYGEIKKVALGRKFAVNKSPDDLCPCGSGKQIKKCGCIQAKYYTEFH